MTRVSAADVAGGDPAAVTRAGGQRVGAVPLALAAFQVAVRSAM
jgi:hypothetical protein